MIDRVEIFVTGLGITIEPAALKKYTLLHERVG